MKANEQISDAPAKVKRPIQAQASKTRKAARKTSTTAGKKLRSARKGSNGHQEFAFSDYSDNAARFITRAKSALGDAYNWVGETGSALPKNARRIGFPDQRELATYIDKKPLIVGALGVGLGVVLATVVPLRRSSAPTKRSAKKSISRK